MRDTPRSTNVWKMTEARAKFSEVFDRALTEGPQELHRRNDVVMVVRKSELEELKRKESVKDVLLNRPEDPPGEPTLTELILEGRRYFNDHDQ